MGREGHRVAGPRRQNWILALDGAPRLSEPRTLFPRHSSEEGASGVARVAVNARKPPTAGSDTARSPTLASNSRPVSAATTMSPNWPSRPSDLTGGSSAPTKDHDCTQKTGFTEDSLRTFTLTTGQVHNRTNKGILD